MKTNEMNETGKQLKHKRTLQQLVSKLATVSTAEAIRKKCFIINDVPETVSISTDENMLASVLSGILHTVIYHAANSCIRIEAKTYGNVILVHVRDSNNPNSQILAGALKEFQPLAEKLGGHLSISGKHENFATIAFSFPNHTKAA